jgi:hypothetical protein
MSERTMLPIPLPSGPPMIAAPAARLALSAGPVAPPLPRRIAAPRSCPPPPRPSADLELLRRVSTALRRL